MQGLVFWLAYPLLWLISILPFPLFYRFSNLVCFLVYKVARYRRKTVQQNLQLVFPAKSSQELAHIEKAFYQHMCDMFLEMIKSISISKEELQMRFQFSNLELLRDYEKKDKSIIVMCAHYASYEWMIALQLFGLEFKSFGIYKKIRNIHFDKLVRQIRGKYQSELIDSHKATKRIIQNERNEVRGIYGMVADQSPKLKTSKLWLRFMDIYVPVFEGSEKLARGLDMNVLYLQVNKTARGFYKATFLPITKNAPAEPEHYITKKFFEFLEQQITEEPEFYLWTHKRWKHRDASLPPGATKVD